MTRLLLLLLVAGLVLAASATAQRGNTPPTACFSASPATPTTGQAVTFDSSCSTDPGGSISSRAWDLDNDGSFDDGTGTTASRTFATPGNYTVRLRVVDNRGSATETSKVIAAANRAPVAAFTFAPAAPATGQAVTFTSTSTDPDGTVASQAWDLDNDGAFDDGTAKTASRTFATPGNYTVRLRAVDNSGAATIVSKSVAAANRAPVAGFTYTPSAPTTGQAVSFSSTSSDPDGTVASQAWDLDNDGSFDDGTAKTVSEAFATPGTYTVRLRAVDNSGAATVMSRTVLAANRGPIASFTFAPANPAPGDTVALTSTSRDEDGRITAQAWDLDNDGAFDDGTATTASLATPAPGSYPVRLRVVDDRGASQIVSYTFVVQDPAATAPPPTTPAQPFDDSTPVAPPQPANPVSALRFLDPFPVVRIRGRTTRRGAQLSMLAVTAPNGARVQVRCKGRGCPAKPLRTTVKARKGKASGTVRFRRLERFLPAGVELQISISKAGLVGKYTRFKIRSLALPIRSDRCLLPGSGRPRACPPPA
jgi:PKD repeat protein